MNDLGRHKSRHGLDTIGIEPTRDVHWNLVPATLYEHAIRRGEGVLAKDGPLLCHTGAHTGRSPNDRFFVENAGGEHVAWGKVNRALAPASWAALKRQVYAHLQERDLFVLDAFAGADPTYRLPLRVVTTKAWCSLFAYNMFVRATAAELPVHQPSFTVLHAPDLLDADDTAGLTSKTFIVVNLEERMILIGGTGYAGEIKKSIFTTMNYLLPARGVMPMHCSANIGEGGDVAVFFGLSGTGKTTLSATRDRTLIGDDEHGWSDDGVFNFEGGCYAKMIRLSPTGEPEIYATTKRFGTILENVAYDEATRTLDLDSSRYTENTRGSYPIDMIPNASETGRGGHARNLVMLTCDAFGVMPPLSKLTPDQAMYHFLSGYTAKVAGTEQGVTEPRAAFSTCFGAPFMPRHPSVYAKLLGEKIARHGAQTWLVNTGWSGGPHGVGRRIQLGYTRAMVQAALSGALADVATTVDPVFGLQVPKAVPGVPGEILQPRNTWSDPQAYDDKATQLSHMFIENFKQYAEYVSEGVRAAGPRA